MSTESLWGNLEDLEEPRSPKSLLEEQAKELRLATRGILRGEVKSNTFLGDIELEFDIIAPRINDYRYQVLKIRYGLDFYPAVINFTENGVIRSVDVADETELKQTIKRIFQADSTRNAIIALKAQSK